MMILYFSGTGNTNFIKDKLKRELNETSIALNDILLDEKKWVFHSDKPFIIMSPIYAWNLPLKILELIKKATFEGSKDVYVIVTMGENYGSAEKSIKKIIKNKNLNFKGFYGFVMPNNYFIGYKLEDIEEQKEIINHSLKEIENVASKIKQLDILTDDGKKKGGKIIVATSSLVNFFFNKYKNKIHKFKVSDKCIKCQKCINNCPTKNIEMKDGKITFNKNCMICLKCVSNCPVKAIDINKKSQENGIYTYFNSSQK